MKLKPKQEALWGEVCVACHSRIGLSEQERIETPAGRLAVHKIGFTPARSSCLEHQMTLSPERRDQVVAYLLKCGVPIVPSRTSRSIQSAEAQVS